MELSTLLFRLGITPNYKAYHQIIAAISLAARDADALLLVTKRLYPAVGQLSHCTWRSVERNIRSAAERAWQCNPALLAELAGHPMAEPPTSSQLIAILAKRCQNVSKLDTEGAKEDSVGQLSERKMAKN